MGGSEELIKVQIQTDPLPDSQYRKFADEFGGASVEVDALPPNVLTGMVENAIRSHIEWNKWAAAGYAERAEKRSLAEFTANLSALGIDPSK